VNRPAAEAPHPSVQHGNISVQSDDAARTKRVGDLGVCGTSNIVSAQAYMALAHHDEDTIQGFLDRGEIVQLKKGTNVYVHLEDGPLSEVTVLSGYYTNRQCWIATLVLSSLQNRAKEKTKD
jgi:hypothetical protein